MTKFYLLTTLILINLGMATQGQACGGMPEGFHEWGAFGEQTVFLSHMPMFGSIHSYQVIVEATLSISGQSVDKAFFASEKSNPAASFTVSPISPTDGTPAYWVLPEQVQVGASFDARVHFQVGDGKDTELFPFATVTIKKIWVNRLFKSQDSKPTQLTYFYFGRGSEKYLAHTLTWDPDFDQILRVTSDMPLPLRSDTATKVVFPIRNNDEANRIHAGEAQLGHSEMTGLINQFNTLNELLEYKVSIQR